MADKTLNFELNKKEENGISSGSKALSVTGNEMSKDEFDKMRDLIYNLSGIYFTENKKYLLESRVSKRIKANNMVSFSQYIYFLQTMYGRKELDALFEAITINETFFYRVPQQFEALENTIIPQLIKMKSHLPNPTIRIWSAATSTGEEAYTLAIIVLEKLKPLYPDVDFKIIGTDINNAVLELARRGIYKEYAVRNMPDSWFSKYFVKDSNKYYLKNEVKNMVEFKTINLYDSKAVQSIPPCDVIFCSNVLIYFDVPSKQKVISGLYKVLNKGGYLFVGYSESLHGISEAFRLVHLLKTMAYQKD